VGTLIIIIAVLAMTFTRGWWMYVAWRRGDISPRAKRFAIEAPALFIVFCAAIVVFVAVGA
jgi:hypothetical protein